MPQRFFHAPYPAPPPVVKTRAASIWGIITDIPHMKLIVAAVIFGAVVIGLIRTLLLGEGQPLLLPVLSAVISGLTILIIDFRQRFGTTYMRLGFHGGMLVFLTAVPMIAPEMIGKTDEQVRFTAGVTIVLCVVGFELAYWFMRTLGGPPRPQPMFYLLAGNYAWANRLLFLGLLSFGIFLAY